jgi:hypothetical protein
VGAVFAYRHWDSVRNLPHQAEHTQIG